MKLNYIMHKEKLNLAIILTINLAYNHKCLLGNNKLLFNIALPLYRNLLLHNSLQIISYTNQWWMTYRQINTQYLLECTCHINHNKYSHKIPLKGHYFRNKTLLKDNSRYKITHICKVYYRQHTTIIKYN